MSGKEEFIELFKEKITRPGADALLNFMEHKSDFFTAPASARYHLACEGGLCEHSLNAVSYTHLKERDRSPQLPSSSPRSSRVFTSSSICHW